MNPTKQTDEHGEFLQCGGLNLADGCHKDHGDSRRQAAECCEQLVAQKPDMTGCYSKNQGAPAPFDVIPDRDSFPWRWGDRK